MMLKNKIKIPGPVHLTNRCRYDSIKGDEAREGKNIVVITDSSKEVSMQRYYDF